MTPMPWNLVKEACEQDWDIFFEFHHSDTAQSPEIHALYEKEKSQRKAQGYDLSYDIQQIMEYRNICLTPNQLPYHVDACHLLIWFKPGYRNQAIQAINDLGQHVVEYCFNQAPEKYRSVQDIEHFHLFLKYT
jgi:hypothetical protein